MSEAASTATPARDPGLQPERTRLAWRRTTLSFMVAALLAGKQALNGGSGPLALLAAGLSLVLWLVFVLVAGRRIRALASARPRPMRRATAFGAVGCTIALAVFAVAVVR
ncbi:DUF202 domain-containing protein [Streptomyces cavernicola]|uniref:DUF202 domain-containing protein n=1 Tax=Streptomyces cavernicola TaxID=3043613 RepID=A0ABT6SLQ3_9ACTN|nr:DUF202 domain-containing protein [Streptomyces sp. B-S-A6]MDI3408607.1 DUF202 domain-containing protein [Streptomyces sp. B-S-A6]